MHDLKLWRDQPDALDAALRRRGLGSIAHGLLERDKALRAVQTELQEQQARRNALSKEIGRLRAQGGDAAAAIAEVGRLKDALQAGEERLRALSEALDAELAGIPNLLADDVPDGADESGNAEIRRWGEARRFGFTPKEHDDLGAPLGMDFARAAKLSGARFVVLFGQLELPRHHARSQEYKIRIEHIAAAVVIDLDELPRLIQILHHVPLHIHLPWLTK